MYPALAGALTALATLLGGGHSTRTLASATACFGFPSCLPDLNHMASNRVHMSSSSGAAAASTKRVFVALEIEEGAKSRLASSVSDIGRTMRHASKIRHMLKWEREDKLHVTLKFLGNMSDSDIPPLCRALSTEMGALEATDFLLQGDGVGTFSGASGMEPNEVRVIWGKLKHESDQRVREIHTAVERACSRAQGSRSKHDPRFHPHVTLARVKARKNATSEERAWVEEVAEGLVKGECRGAGEFESLVTGVSLMESTQVQGDTTDYRRLDFFPFGASSTAEHSEESGQEGGGRRGGEHVEEQGEWAEGDIRAKRQRTSYQW